MRQIRVALAGHVNDSWVDGISAGKSRSILAAATTHHPSSDPGIDTSLVHQHQESSEIREETTKNEKGTTKKQHNSHGASWRLKHMLLIPSGRMKASIR
jgi:hypothetical protein